MRRPDRRHPPTMVSDDELERRVDAFEHSAGRDDELAARVERIERTASEVNDELARRIEQTRANAADAEYLREVVARLDDIEKRLASVEERLE